MRPALALAALVLGAAACRTSAPVRPLADVVPPGTASFALDPIPVPRSARLEDRVADAGPPGGALSADGRRVDDLPPEGYRLTIEAGPHGAIARVEYSTPTGWRWAMMTLWQLRVVADGRVWIRLGRVEDRPGFPLRGNKRPRGWEMFYKANLAYQNVPEIFGPRYLPVLSPGGTLDVGPDGLRRAEKFLRTFNPDWYAGMAIEFDDVPFGMTPDTSERFGGYYPRALVVYLRRCREILREVDPAAVLYWLPQTYWTDAERLPEFARDLRVAGGLPADLGLVLTGPEVISERITREDIARARRAFGLTETKALVYDNLGREGDHGPLTGRAPDLCEEADAVFGERGEPLNRITRLDYAWNPEAYDPRRSHLLACREVFGAAAAPFVSRLVLGGSLTAGQREWLFREALRRIDPSGRGPVDARAYLRRVRIDVMARAARP